MDIPERERWTIWSLPGTQGQRVVAVDGRVPDARERIEVVEARPATARGAVSLSDDETKALVWAAHRAARYLRAEGWPDSKSNAEILDRAIEKLESTDPSRGAVDAERHAEVLAEMVKYRAQLATAVEERDAARREVAERQLEERTR